VHTKTGNWKIELKATQGNVSTLREQFLNEIAHYLAEKRNTEATDELKILKHHENKQRKEAARIIFLGKCPFIK